MDALNLLNKEYYAIGNSCGTEFKTRSIHLKGYRFLLISFIVAFFAISANATVYYVSNLGNDANTGTSVSSPWKTLVKVNGFSFKPGDQVLFKSGDEWYGTLIPRTSGTSGNPIVYGAYGTGEKPKIYGSEVITGWTVHSGNIYKATVSSDVKQLFANDVRVNIARYPKDTYADVTTVNSTTQFTSTHITSQASNYYQGAIAILKTSRYNLVDANVIASSGQTLTLNEAPYGSLGLNEGFFLINKLEFLTQANEWYYDGVNTVYLWTPSGSTPDSYVIRASNTDYGVTGTNVNYITIENIDFYEQATSSIILNSCDYVEIKGCSFINPALNGVDATNYCTYITVEECFSTGAMNSSTWFVNSSNTNVTNNTFTNCGKLENITLNTGFTTSPGQNIYLNYCTNSSVTYNKVYDSGYAGIKMNNGVYDISYNVVDTACTLLDDGGAIYTYNGNDYGNTGISGSTISYNIVSNSYGTADGVNNVTRYGYGIYLDNNTHDVDILYNTVFNCSGATMHNANGNITLAYNTLFDNGVGTVINNTVENFQYNNNIIYLTNRTGSWLVKRNTYQRAIVSAGTYATYNSNKYVSPYQSTVFNEYINFADWKTASSGDENSTINTTALNTGETEHLYYNATTLAANVDLGGYIHKDLDGNTVTSKVLQPFTSVILIKTDKTASVQDVTKPVISSFIIPSSSSSFMVEVSSLSASDNIGITGYLITESATVPNLTNSNWNVSVPSSYTFSSQGTKSLYAWAKDGAGNISLSKSAQVIITLPSSSSNSIGYFDLFGYSSTDTNLRAMPVTFNVTSEINSISIYHEGGTGNLILGVYSEQNNTPSSRLGITKSTILSSSAGWQTIELTKPVVVESGQTVWLSWLFENNPGIRYTVGTPGRASSSNTWTSGMPETFGSSNISNYKYSIYCTVSNVTLPEVSSFQIPGDYHSLVIPVSEFTASGSSEITGYLITENNVSPEIEGEGWSNEPPASYTFTSEGTKNLYAWVKDVAGNVSNSVSGTVIISLPAIYTSESISICEGESYKGWTESGQYETTYVLDSGADSIVSTILTVNPVYQVSEEITILEGENYEGWAESGVYERILTSVTGCDSVVTTNLSVTLHIIYTSEEIVIVEGDNYCGWTESGLYERTLIASTGCDSVITTNLTVISTEYTTENISICEGDSYEGLTTSGEYQRILTGSSGADSIVTTYLTVYPAYEVFEEITIFDGGNYFGWTESGQYQRTLIASTGCDSIVITNLNVTTNEYATENISICEGDSYEGWTTSGQYQRVLLAYSGADSVVITNLTVNPNYYITENITILKGEEYFGWTESGNYTRALLTTTGCDSIINTNLIVMDHFKPVWWNENGQNHMNFQIVDARINDIPLDVNDEIGIFDGNICVGVAKLAFAINANDISTQLFVKTSQDDGRKNGFITGNQISFRIWDFDKQVELVATNVIYKNDLAEWVTTGKFVAGGTSVVEIRNEQTEQIQTQSIVLKRGWNMFSSSVIPENLGMDAVQEMLTSMGYLIKVQDEEGNTYERLNAKNGWINNIGDIQKTEGYQIRVKSDCVLELTGLPVALPLNIPLRKGSNLISFPYNGSVDAMQVIQPLINAGILDKVQDERGNSIENWRGSIGWVNSIGNFKAGEGYLVQVNANGVLSISGAYEKSVRIMANEEDTEYFNVEYEGNGIGHMNINITHLQELNLKVGDEIGAFDGTICVGSVKLNDFHIDNDLASIHASAADTDILNGFIEGNEIELKVWRAGENSEIDPNAQLIEGVLTYQQFGSVFVQFVKQSVTGVESLNLLTTEIYPNPVVDKVTVRFSNLPETGTKIILLDATGSELLYRDVTSSQEILDIQSQPSGIYLVKIISGDHFETRKIVKN